MRKVIFNLLNRGAPPSTDAGAMIEIADVPLAQGPMLVHALETSGIVASGIESYDVATGVRSRMRIMVRQGDKEHAKAIVDQAP